MIIPAEPRPSYSWENKQYLLKLMMNQLGITEQDLEKDPSWIKAKVREMRIETILGSQSEKIFNKKKIKILKKIKRGHIF